MLEEGLFEQDHISLNTTIYCVTKQQIDNQKFIHEPTTIVLNKLSCKPWKKTNQPTANKRSSMKTIVSALKHRVTVKQLTACSTEQLLVFNNSPILLGVPGKKTSRGHPHSLGDCLILDPSSPPNFRFPPWGRGVWIFSGTTHFDFKSVWFRARKVTGTFKRWTPGPKDWTFKV